MITRSRPFAIMVITLMLLLACEPPPANEGLSIFRYNEAAGISSLDPAFARDLASIWACNQLFDGLVSLNDRLEVEACVARAWDISDDGLTYTFYLRDDVVFHPHKAFPDGKGRKVNARDFEYSFYRITDPGLASPGAWVFNNVADSGFRAIDDTTFTISLRQAFPPFLSLLSMQYCNAVPEEVVERSGKDFRLEPVGCGPFRFKYWKEGVKLVFQGNPDYFLYDNKGVRLPYLDAVSISFLIDKQSAFLQFLQGKIDFLSGIDASYKDELLTPEGKLNPEYDQSIYLLREPYLNTEYLGILVDSNTYEDKHSPLLKKKVRQAINYGFDRRKMMRYLRNNIGIPGYAGMIPAGMPSFDTAAYYGYSHDPARAGKLLEQAGYPGGRGLPPITITTSPEYLDLCKYMQHELNQLGFDIRISVSPPAAIKEMKAQAKLPFFRASWIADYPDAENYLSLFYSPNHCPDGPNYTHFTSPVFDEMYETSLETFDEAERFELYREMDSLIMTEAPVVVLFYDEVLRFVQHDISGLGINPVNLLDLTHVKKNK